MLKLIPRQTRRSDRRAPRGHRRVSAGLTAAAMGLTLALASTGAPAQTLGTPSGLSTRTEIVDFLGQTYDEAPVAGGIASNGSVLEVFTSPDGQSWTIILTSPDGTSRVVAAGETWLELLKLKGERI